MEILLLIVVKYIHAFTHSHIIVFWSFWLCSCCGYYLQAGKDCCL